MRPLKIASVVVAVHLIVLGFFLFKPPLNYFAVTCLSTVVVWPTVFWFRKRNRRTAIIAGSLLQLGTQQFAYHAWLAGQAGVLWPLLQFIALQYVVALRLGSPPEDA